jgi:hypothetical protein
MRPVLVAVDEPNDGDRIDIGERVAHIGVEHFLAKAAAEQHDSGILVELTGFDIQRPQAAGLG